MVLSINSKERSEVSLLDKDKALELITDNPDYPMLSQYTKVVTKMNRPVIGRENEMRRVLSSFERPEISNVILLGDAGSGKGHTPDTIIAVDDEREYIKFGDLKVGDYVFDEYGSATQVLGVYPQGLLPTYDVVFEDGSSVVVNGEHLWAYQFADYEIETELMVDTTDKLRSLIDKGQCIYVPDNGVIKRSIPELQDAQNARFEWLSSIVKKNKVIEDGNFYFLINEDDMDKARSVLYEFGIKHKMCFMGNRKLAIYLLDRCNTWLDLLTGTYFKSTATATRIVSINPRNKEEEIICIMVDNPSHLYQVGYEHIVTHNTTLVSGLALQDPKGRLYMEVDLSKMVAGAKDTNEMGAFLKQLADEVEDIGKVFKTEVVLFMDEIHQIMKLSDIAMEALKPILANSGIRGIRIICATTYGEFDQYIAGNQALVERLQRINLTQPGEEVTVNILKGMVDRYIPGTVVDPIVFKQIFEFTNRYIPANSQPRKSLDLLDGMIGEHRLTGVDIDSKLIGEMLYRSQGVRVTLNVDPMTIRERLDAKVYAQGMATQIIEDSLQNCLAGLNNPDKPMSTLLFTGSTGVGKMVANDVLVPTPSGKWVRHGDLKPGDLVFNRKGEPIKIISVHPHENMDMYKVTLKDGRNVVVGGEHLWTVFTKNSRKDRDGKTLTTVDLYKSGVTKERHGKVVTKWWIDKNKCVSYELNNHPNVDFYATGRLIAEGDSSLFSSDYLVENESNRLLLLQGLFDTNGFILDDKRCSIGYESNDYSLIKQMTTLVRSLGFGCFIKNEGVLYRLDVKASIDDKLKFFKLDDKLEKIKSHIDDTGGANYDFVGIESIEYVGVDNAQCIYVDDPEHLYLIDDYIVTHNTEISKRLADILFEDPRSFIRFDMTEYSQPSSVERFRDEVTRRVWERPFSVLLFDEIEKACGDVTRMLLQITDDARLINRHNREVSFKNCYILITTNAGAEIYETVAHYMKSDTGENNKGLMKLMPIIKESLRTTMGENKFPPELLGRLTAIVPFQPLSENTKYKIATAKVKKLQKLVYDKHGVTLQVHKRVLDYIIKDNLSDDANDGGGRSVINKLDTEVTTEISRFINQYPQIKYIRVSVKGELASETKFSKESKGEIVVESYRPST